MQQNNAKEINDPAHVIWVFSSYLVGLGLDFLPELSSTSLLCVCEQLAKVLARLSKCEVSSEPSLFIDEISTKISRAGQYVNTNTIVILHNSMETGKR